MSAEAASVWEDNAVWVCPLLLDTKGVECSRDGHLQVRNAQSSLAIRAASRPSTYRSWHSLHRWSCTLISVEICQPELLRIWLWSCPSSISQVVPLHICFVYCQKQDEGARQWTAKLFICLFKCLGVFLNGQIIKKKWYLTKQNQLAAMPADRAEWQISCSLRRDWLNWLFCSSFAQSCPCFHLLCVHHHQEQLMQNRPDTFTSPNCYRWSVCCSELLSALSWM